MKVSVIFGTRPEAIKLAPVVLGLQAHPSLQAHVCVTGQHREMLDQALSIFGIKPDVDFNLMKHNQSLGELTSSLIASLEQYMKEEKPDLVLAQGDTTTAFCATLVAFYHQIPVGHVEAGLRTWNLYSPWPEEANRVLTGKLASLHFAPTSLNKENLIKEGVSEERIFVTGNTVIDSLFLAKERIAAEPPNIPGLPPEVLAENRPPLVLITGHRRENFGQGFESICRAIAALAREFPETNFVYPVHLNPRVREPVFRILTEHEDDSKSLKNVHIIEPLSYLPFVHIMDKSSMILTDSGGIQEEAPGLGKPVLVMRDTTERPEAVYAGTVKLVGTSYRGIFNETRKLLIDELTYRSMSQARNPYGDGKSAERILFFCLNYLKNLRKTA